MLQTVDLGQISKRITGLVRAKGMYLVERDVALGSKHSFGDCIIPFIPPTNSWDITCVTIKPTTKSVYWRAGFKFSPTPEAITPPHRQGLNHPLVHVTCNNVPSRVLGVTYYHDGEEDTAASGVIIDDYYNQELRLYLFKGTTGDLIFAVRRQSRCIYARKLYERENDPTHSADTYDFVTLSSWGDMYTYELRSKLSVKKCTERAA